MPYDPERHHRRSIRLPGYDYTQPGAYFVTICAHEGKHLFGEVVDGVMVLNPHGEIVRDEWFKTAEIRPTVRLDEMEFVVMPNHIHGIIWIVDDVGVTGGDPVGARRRRAPTAGRAPTVGRAPAMEQFGKPVPCSIPTIVRAFKSAVAKRINAVRGAPGSPVWQRNYYEQIIRDEDALDAIRRYIAENPARWALDRYNLTRQGDDPLAAEIRRRLHANTPSQGAPDDQ